MDNSRIICIGGGDLCREFLSLLYNSQNTLNKTNLFYLDQKEKTFFNKDLEPSYLGNLNNFKPRNDDKIYLTISDTKLKEQIFEENKFLENHIQTFIHPSCVISKSAKIGKGCILFPFVYLSECSTLGNFIHLNSYVGIGHDSIISDYCTISAQVDVAGHCILDKCCFMGSGSRIIPRRRIGNYSSIGAGSVVIKNIPESTNVFGNPAKKIII